MTLRSAWLHLLARSTRGVAAAGDGDMAHLAARMACFHGRESLPWALGCVLGAAVARFLPHRLTARLVANVALPRPVPASRDAAFTVDGACLLVPRADDAGVNVVRVCDGALLRTFGDVLDSKAMPYLKRPVQVCVAPDGAVCVATYTQVAVLTPAYNFERFLAHPQDVPLSGVAADTDVVFVATPCLYKILVFARPNGALLRSIETSRYSCGFSKMREKLADARACIVRVAGVRYVACTVQRRRCVGLFQDDGACVTLLGADILAWPSTLAFRAASDELVVLDDHAGVVVFSLAQGVAHAAARVLLPPPCRDGALAVCDDGTLCVTVINAPPPPPARPSTPEPVTDDAVLMSWPYSNRQTQALRLYV